MKKIEEFTIFLTDLQDFKKGVELLLHGFLSPVLIDKTSLQNTLGLLRLHLRYKHPKARLIWKVPSQYYNAHDYTFGRHGDHLLIQVHFPLTILETPLTLFEIETFPVTMPGDGGHVTQVTDLPRCIMTRQRYPFYMTTDTISTHGTPRLIYMTKTNEPMRSFQDAPSCAAALFQNKVTQIRQLCNFRLHLDALQPTIKFLTDTKM